MSADQGSEGRKRYAELVRKGFRTLIKVARWSGRILRGMRFLWMFHQADNQVVHDLASWLSALFGG